MVSHLTALEQICTCWEAFPRSARAGAAAIFVMNNVHGVNNVYEISCVVPCGEFFDRDGTATG